MSGPGPYSVNPGWSASEPPKPVSLHCLCGLSFEEVPPGGALAFTAKWYQVHCGTGHGPSPVHVEKPTLAAVLTTYVHAHEALNGSVKDLVLSLRLAAEDLIQAEPTDTKELEGKLDSLITTVLEGLAAVDDALETYKALPEEPER
jgi:hypothetical protein